MPVLSDTIARFAPISLAEMDGVKLQDRVDTKYVLGVAELDIVLEAMLPHYRLLEVEGVRGTSYRSLYFDTARLQHYQDHHNKRTFRVKVRYREYIGADLAFLEVKRKTGRGGTDKARLRVPGIPDNMPVDHAAFVARASGREEELVPTLWNHFTRYTFVHRERAERLTIDTALRYSANGSEIGLDGIVVAELKQGRADRMSDFVRIMRERNIRPSGMSKYCIGMLLLGGPVKHNAFKETMLRLERIRHAA